MPVVTPRIVITLADALLRETVHASLADVGCPLVDAEQASADDLELRLASDGQIAGCAVPGEPAFHIAQAPLVVARLEAVNDRPTATVEDADGMRRPAPVQGARGLDVACGCFGGAAEQAQVTGDPVRPLHLLRNLGLLGLVALVLAEARAAAPDVR